MKNAILPKDPEKIKGFLKEYQRTYDAKEKARDYTGLNHLQTWQDALFENLVVSTKDGETYLLQKSVEEDNEYTPLHRKIKQARKDLISNKALAIAFIRYAQSYDFKLNAEQQKLTYFPFWLCPFKKTADDIPMLLNSGETVSLTLLREHQKNLLIRWLSEPTTVNYQWKWYELLLSVFLFYPEFNLKEISHDLKIKNSFGIAEMRLNYSLLSLLLNTQKDFLYEQNIVNQLIQYQKDCRLWKKTSLIECVSYLAALFFLIPYLMRWINTSFVMNLLFSGLGVLSYLYFGAHPAYEDKFDIGVAIGGIVASITEKDVFAPRFYVESQFSECFAHFIRGLGLCVTYSITKIVLDIIHRLQHIGQEERLLQQLIAQINPEILVVEKDVNEELSMTRLSMAV